MRFRGLAAVVAASLWWPAPAHAQVTIDRGRTFRVALNQRIALGANTRVTATVIEPVFVGDRIAVPVGTIVAGRADALNRPSAAVRVRDASGGDFTPKDAAVLTFDALTLPDRTRKTIAATADGGRDAAAAGVRQWVKEYVLGQLPYHRRYVHAGAQYTVTLIEPVSLDGAVRMTPDATNDGRVRLMTPLDSSTVAVGAPVRVVVDRPLVNARGETVLEGATLDGTITQVTRAGAMHRQGRVRFAIDGMTGLVTVADSKWRFALPILAAGTLPAARDGDRGHLGNLLGRGGAGWSGFEMIGAAVAQTSGPVAIGFGVWGVARGVWINVLSRGHNAVLPAGTIIELSSPPSAAARRIAPST